MTSKYDKRHLKYRSAARHSNGARMLMDYEIKNWARGIEAIQQSRDLRLPLRIYYSWEKR